MSNAGPPDVNAQLLQMQAMIASSQQQGNGTKLNIFSLGLPDADVFSGLSCKGKGFNLEKNVMPMPNKKGPGKFAKACAEAFDAVAKINKENFPQPAPFQQASIGDIAGHGFGGSFASSVARDVGGDGGHSV
jgi:hypothetical protein